MLLELLGSREKKNKASSRSSLSLWCVCCAKKPTLCMGAPGGLSGWALVPAVSVYARRLLRRLLGPADWWAPPAAGLLADRPAPPPRVLSAAAYCCLAPDDEGSVEVSVATVCRLEGSHCSLT